MQSAGSTSNRQQGVYCNAPLSFWFNPLLLLLGVILGVNQVALGLQLMLGGMEGLIALGVFAAPGK